MIDPRKALDAKWLAYQETFIPHDAGPNQKAALAYAYYRGMKGVLEILHEMSATEPTDTEITAFMNNLETALSNFHDTATTRAIQKF